MTPFRMQRIGAAIIASMALSSIMTIPAGAEQPDGNAELTATITALDQQVFDAYNPCDLDSFQQFFDPAVEFYHDMGGVTWDRDTVVANTRQWICGRVRRELLPETLRVYPIRDYGAIEEGEHRFCQTGTGQCEGIAKFLMIWRNDHGRWVMTRVISYGHRPNPTP